MHSAFPIGRDSGYSECACSLQSLYGTLGVYGNLKSVYLGGRVIRAYQEQVLGVESLQGEKCGLTHEQTSILRT